MTECPYRSTATSLQEWNPLDPQELAWPYGTFGRARQEEPVFFAETMGAWIVTRYADVMTAVRDTKNFTSRNSIGSGEVPPEVADLLPSGYCWHYPSLVNNDPPAHTRVRRLVNEAFRRHEVEARGDEVAEIANKLVDAFVEAGRVDFISAFADKLPSTVMCRMLGVDDEWEAQVTEWSDEFLLMLDPTLPHERRVELARRQADYNKFCEEFVAERKVRPQDDLISRLLQAEVDGEPTLTDAEVISTFSQLLLGGNETTRRMLGNMILRLLEHPDQLEQVRKAPTELADAVVEESLRHSTSVKGLFRMASADVELGGKLIREGDNLVVMWSSANHDEHQFESPAEFNIFRSDASRHVAFSRFAHHCIGAPLARLEMRVSLETVLNRLPNVRLAKNHRLEWMSLPLHMGLSRLDIEWDRDGARLPTG